MIRSLLVAALALLTALPALAQSVTLSFAGGGAVVPDLPVVIYSDDPADAARLDTTSSTGQVVLDGLVSGRRYYGYPAEGTGFVTRFSIPAAAGGDGGSPSGFVIMNPVDPASGIVRGQATDSRTGDGLRNASVVVTTPAGVGVGAIDGAGAYAVQLGAGTYDATYTVFGNLFGPGRVFRAQTVPLSVEAGSGATRDLIFVERLPGTVSGTVADAVTGAPVAGTTVQAIAVDGSAFREAETDAAGRFTLDAPENDYTVGIRGGDGYLPQVFDGATTEAAATIVTVVAGQTRPDVDFALVRPAADFAVTFTGRVTAADGTPIAADGRLFTDVFVPDVAFTAGADGTFSYTTTDTDLAASLLAIEMSAPGFEAEFFDDKPNRSVADLFETGAEAITFDLGEIVLTADGEDGDGLVLSGTVTDVTTGVPLAGALVAAARIDAPGIRYGVSDATGGYRIDGLDAGRYVVLFTERDHAPEFFPNAETSSSAQILDIDGDRGGVDGLMGGLNRPVGARSGDAGGMVAARLGGNAVRGVVRSGGVAVAGALVTVHGSNGPQAYALSDAAGRFSLDQTDDLVSVRVDRPRFALSSSTLRASTGGQLLVTLDASAATSGEADPEAQTTALRVYPNPTRGQTTVAFSLESAGEARVSLYDVLGREVAIVAQDERAAGAHTVDLDTARLAPGVYVVRVVAGGASQTRTITVVR